MDRRTLELIDSLAHPGGLALFCLLSDGALTEDQLLEKVPDTSQSTMNRRLKQMSNAGLLKRAPGPRQYKGRPWAATAPEAVDALLGAALELAHAVSSQEDAERQVAAAQLRQGRKRRRRLETVDRDHSTEDA